MSSAPPVPSPAPFLAVAAVLSVLTVAGAVPAWAGLVHQVAVPPLDLFADVRFLTARSTTYPQFVAGLATSLLVRSAVVAVAIGGLSWRRLLLVLRFYVLVLPLALVVAAFTFTGLAVSYALFVWPAIVVAVIVTFVFAAVPWSDGDRLRHRFRTAFRRRLHVGALALYLVTLVVVGAFADGTAQTLAAMWVSALLTVVVVHRLAGGDRRLIGLPARGGAVTAVPLLFLALLPVSSTAPVTQAADEETVLFVVPGVSTQSGKGTMFTLEPGDLGFTCERTHYFSYAGPGDGAPQRESVCPIRTGAPFDEVDSQAPLADLRSRFAEQIRRLPAPAVVITHSQGAWIAADALDRNPDLDVEALVMLAPFPVHDVGYEPRGGDPSPRREAVRGVFGTVRLIDEPSFRTDAPLARQLLATPGAIDRIMATPLPGVRSLAVNSWFDLVGMPRGWRTPFAHDACPVFVHHGSLPTADTVDEVITDFLAVDERSACPWYRTALASVAAPFTVPPDPGHG